MRGFRVWTREEGFIVEGVEWSTDGPCLARRFDFEPHAYWEFQNINRARDYFVAAFGPDAHVIFASQGELRFELPGLLPSSKPSEPGNDATPPPNLIEPERPDAPRRKRRVVGKELE